MSKVIFSYNGTQTTIQCLQDDKMKNICDKYASKICININSLFFIYGGNQINYELTFQEQANNIDKGRNEMNILVYKQEPEDENKVKCPKCGEIIKIEKFDNIIKFNSNQSEMLNEIKNEIEIINKSNEINKIKNKIKIINLIINDLIEEIKKNKKNIQNFLSNNFNEIKNVENDINKKTNIIKGIFNVEDIYQDVAIFNQYVEDEGFDVYLNNEKINVIKSYKV